MHPLNPFAKDYDFATLTQQDANLKEYVFVNKYGSTTISFANPRAVKALNRALLKTHYDINWDIPPSYLCPPIPGRLDYLLHVADLVGQSRVRMLDIGTGANLIYPILATCHLHWQCTASEVDRVALQNAQTIIDQNPALQNIELRAQKFKNSIFAHLIQPTDTFDVVVCNPPFFKNRFAAQQQNERKTKNLRLPQTNTPNFGGQSHELWYKGGEEAFVKKMATESADYQAQVHWFTALVSRQEHLKNIKRAINKTQPTEVKVIPMEQGHKVSRIVAWTFR